MNLTQSYHCFQVVVVGLLGCGDVLLDFAVLLYRVPGFQSVQPAPRRRLQNSELLQQGSRHDKNIASVPEPEHSRCKVGPDCTESCGAGIAHKTERVAFDDVWELGDFQQKIHPRIPFAASRSIFDVGLCDIDSGHVCNVFVYERGPSNAEHYHRGFLGPKRSTE